MLTVNTRITKDYVVNSILIRSVVSFQNQLTYKHIHVQATYKIPFHVHNLWSYFISLNIFISFIFYLDFDENTQMKNINSIQTYLFIFDTT